MSIRLDHVTKRFGSTVAVDDVSFHVANGELVTILGPSGCGKTTTLRIIAGLETQDRGTVSIGEQSVDHVPAQKRNVGFVFQTYSLFRYMTILENVEFGLRIRRVSRGERRKKALDLLALVGLAGFESRYPTMLSGGQRQRVSLARALAYGPATLLLDEPFGALDAKIRKRLAADLKAIQRELKITTLFVTHDQAQALELGDRVIIMNRGKIEQFGSPEEIYDHPRTKFVASFVGMVNVLDGIIAGRQVRIGSLLVEGKRFEPSGDFRDGERVAVLIRPEDIDIRRDEAAGFHPGTIVDIRFQGAFLECEIECGGEIVKAVESKGDLQQSGLRVGDRVWVHLISSRMFPLEEDVASMKERLKTLGYIE